MTEQLLTTSEVAERLKISVRAVQDLILGGKLPTCQVTSQRRMVPSGALTKWIEQNTVWPDQSLTASRQVSGMSSGGREAANVAALHERRIDMPPRDG
jgi:excisionase family DNA binding protein